MTEENNRAGNVINPSWGLLAIIWFVIFFLYIMSHAVSPLLHLIITDMEITYWQGGILYSAPSAVIAFFAYPFGTLLDRIGTEKAIVLGMLTAVAFGFLRGTAPNYLALLVANLIFGAGLALCYVSLPKFAKRYFPVALITVATGIYTSAIPAGVGTGIFAAGFLSQYLYLEWHEVFYALSLAAVPILLLCFLMLNKSARSSGNELRAKGKVIPSTSGPTVSGLRSNFKVVLVGGILLMLLNLLFYSMVGWLPTYLIEKGWESDAAAFVASAIPLIEIPVIVIVPFFVSGRKRLFITCGYLGIGISILILSFFPSLVWLACLFLGISAGVIFPLLLSLPAEIPNIVEDVGKVSGVFFSLGYIGPLLGSPLLGMVKDLYGDFYPGFLVLILLSFLAALLSSYLPEFSTVESLGNNGIIP